MNPNWLGLLCAGLSALAFFWSFRLGMKATARKRVFCAILALLCAIPGVSFGIYYFHVLPDMACYFEFRSWRGTELLLILLGVAGGFTASLLPRKLLVAPLLGTLALALIPFAKSCLYPLPLNSLKDSWRDGVCFQTSSSTCGAASLATVLKFNGVPASEREIAREAYSYLGGTESWYLARVARSRGCVAMFRFSSGFDPEAKLPAVAGVKLGEVGHFIAILAREGDRYIIGDPCVGRETLSRDKLLTRYSFSGFYMSVLK